ncbi:hypothetical protein SDJN02_12184, partial [Cucurbita argyrosperma subsp. argyrosperma]
MAANGGSSAANSHSQPTFPLHLCFFFLILLMFLSFSWYSNYESAVEGVFDQLKLLLIVSPLLLLLLVHWLSNAGNFLFPEKDSLQNPGATWRTPVRASKASYDQTQASSHRLRPLPPPSSSRILLRLLQRCPETFLLSQKQEKRRRFTPRRLRRLHLGASRDSYGGRVSLLL